MFFRYDKLLSLSVYCGTACPSGSWGEKNDANKKREKTLWENAGANYSQRAVLSECYNVMSSNQPKQLSLNDSAGEAWRQHLFCWERKKHIHIGTGQLYGSQLEFRFWVQILFTCNWVARCLSAISQVIGILRPQTPFGSRAQLLEAGMKRVGS